MKNKHLAMAITWGLLALSLVLAWLIGPPGIVRPAEAATRLAEFTVCPAGPPDCDYGIVQDAVDAANGGDTIKVATGTYTDIHTRAGLTQTVYLSKSLTIRGGYSADFAAWDPEVYSTTLDAGGQGRVFYISGSWANPIEITIEGLRITGGAASSNGGGIFANDATAKIGHNEIFGNSAATLGGGIAIGYGGAHLDGNIIADNSAPNCGGGWLGYSVDAYDLRSNLITLNDALMTGGGLCLSNCTANLTDNTIASNTGGAAGGLHSSSSTVTLDGNVLSDNSANGYGGGSYFDNSTMLLENNVIADNRANGRGSGLYIEGSTARLLHTTLAENRAGDGVGIYVIDYFGIYSNIVLSNTIVTSHSVGITVATGSRVALEATLWGAGSWANDVDWGGAGEILTGTLNLWAQPDFVDPSAGDYHLASGSAAMDAGIDAGVDHDLDGETRPQGGGYDIGADEFGLGLAKRAEPQIVQSGAVLTYTIFLTNTTDLTLQATVTDTLPAQVSPAALRVWTPAPIPPGVVWSETFTVTVDPGYVGVLTNVVQATTLEGPGSVYIETSQAQAPSVLLVTSAADSGPGTLREALLTAVASDTITFDPAIFPPASPVTIPLASPLPSLTQGQLTIDAGNAGVILDGSALASGSGLDVRSDGNTIRGLQIYHFPEDGIRIQEAAYNLVGGSTSAARNVLSGNEMHGVNIMGTGAVSNTISGNYIGTDASGTDAMGNAWRGVSLGPGAWYNVIGGANATPGGACTGACNVISGNTYQGVVMDGGDIMHNTVSGNYIGTDVNGTYALPNRGGLWLGFGPMYNVIGGDRTAGEGNLISGNTFGGVNIQRSGTAHNVVRGNLIGTDAAGVAAIGGQSYGVTVKLGAQYNLVGGDSEADRNLISGNDGNGIEIYDPDTRYNTVSGNYVGTNLTGTAAVGNGYSGVVVSAGASDNFVGGNSAGEGNVISGNADHGVRLSGSGTLSNTIGGNYIGTDAGGTGAIPNTDYGVRLGGGAAYNFVGKRNSTPGAACSGWCNVISGNGIDGVSVYGSGTEYNIVAGNYIGLDASGTTPLGNGFEGVTLESGARLNHVGGYTAGERNVIGGNGNNGLLLHTGVMSNTICGNFVGTDAAGTAAIGNTHDGIRIGDGASGNSIGGPSDFLRNVIAYNGGRGVAIDGSGASGNRVQNNWVGLDADGTGGLDPRNLVAADDGTLFLANYGRGVFKSGDAAVSWQAVNSGLTTLEIEILAVAPDFATSQRLWAWGGGQLFVSDDGGATWLPLSGALSTKVNALAVSPNYGLDQTLLAAVEGQGLYKSVDGGTTWYLVYATAEHSVAYDSLAFSPDFALDQVVLAGLGWSGVIRSTDGGESWSSSNAGLPSLPVLDLAFAPDAQTVLLASSHCGNDGVYRSDDGGQSWIASGSGLGDCGSAWQVAVSPDFATDGIALAMEDQLFRSADGGSNWNWSGNGVFGSRGQALAFSPDFAADGTVYAASFAGVFCSTDGGLNWSWAGANLADRGNGGHGIEVCCGAGKTRILDNVVGGNAAYGIYVGAPGAAGSLVDGNLVGLAPDGSTRAANGNTNIRLDAPHVTVSDNVSAAGSHGGLRAGPAAHHLTIESNRFGTDAAGLLAIGNSYDGLTLDSAWNTVRDNQISGNWGDGIYATENVSNSLLAGNLIGLDATGTRTLSNGGAHPVPGGNVPWRGIDGGLGNDSFGINMRGSYNTIGGSTAADRNVISGNAGHGIFLREPAHDNLIVGNYIGTDAGGLAALGNAYYGLYLFRGAHDNTVGGSTAGEGNVISGNGGDGLVVWDAANNAILGNHIGADADGLATLGNGWNGIRLGSGTSHTLIGAGNLIAGNDGAGVAVYDGASLYNTVTHNSISGNAGLGIDLVNGGNTELPAPVINAYDLAAGTASGTTCANCTVELFSDDHGEGHWFEAATAADARGNWSLAKGSAFAGPELTATATDGAGNTSEFGQDWPADPPPAPHIAAPACGVTNQSTPVFAGFAQMGSTVTLGAGGLQLGQATTDDWNRWLLTSGTPLPDVAYTVTATATTAWGTSPQAELALTVDTGLCYDPVAVTFAQRGVTQQPRNAAGCVDPGEVLGVNLWPDLPVTVSVPVEVPTATVSVEVNSVPYDLGDADDDGLFSGAFPAPSGGSFVLLLVVDCGGGPQTMQIGSTIDPDGYVYDGAVAASSGVTETIAGVTVTLYVSDTVRGRWLAWDAALYGQRNPQVTGEDGYFAFFTPPGSYKLVADGRYLRYELYESPVLTVIDEPIRYNVPLWKRIERYYLPVIRRGQP